MGENTGKNRDERKLIPLEEMKGNKPGNVRQNLLGKRLPGMPFLPVRLDYGSNDQILEFDLNRMPHLSVAGGTPEYQASVIRQILQYWECRSWIKPEVIDLTGKLDPEKPAAEQDLSLFSCRT